MNKVPDSTVKNLIAMTTLESAQQLHAMARGLCCKMSFMQRKPYLAKYVCTSFYRLNWIVRGAGIGCFIIYKVNLRRCYEKSLFLCLLCAYLNCD